MGKGQDGTVPRFFVPVTRDKKTFEKDRNSRPVALSPGSGPNPGDKRDRHPEKSRDNRPSLVRKDNLQVNLLSDYDLTNS